MEKKKYNSIYEALYVEPTPEPEFGPSMVEPCHNLSIAEILSDYSRGIAHSMRETFYDDGEDLPEDLDEIEDLVDIQKSVTLNPSAAADGQVREVGKPSGIKEAERSEADECKEGPGTEAD